MALVLAQISSTFVFDAKVLLNKGVGKDSENVTYIFTNNA